MSLHYSGGAGGGTQGLKGGVRPDWPSWGKASGMLPQPLLASRKGQLQKGEEHASGVLNSPVDPR